MLALAEVVVVVVTRETFSIVPQEGADSRRRRRQPLGAHYCVHGEFACATFADPAELGNPPQYLSLVTSIDSLFTISPKTAPRLSG